ncbi:hypothetical protein N2601_23790 (plasmid) [Rhizobium sp. CB3060]|uniref:hypothetical protein n=1 Tax=Rhizobium sp. CB3060 TaxID=3138255 RepID=UPI0021A375C6|nr:hypothetical protein [Rhizobium tropici]UWU25157.1 hypothetical protein N2601_23790 [Rhizobium tropici]
MIISWQRTLHPMNGERHMTRWQTLFLSLGLFAGVAPTCLASSLAYRGIEDDRTSDLKHGLFEIREEARQFIARENMADGTRWEALDPNLKIQVPRCAVPLTVKWVPKTYGLSAPNVAVTCSRTIDGSWEGHWNVFVPVRLKR